MKKISLDNFTLEEFDFQNLLHDKILFELNKTTEEKNFLGNLKYMALKIEQRKLIDPLNALYITYYDENPIGFISLSNINNQYQISYGIIPQFQGQYLGSMLLQEFSYYLFDKNPSINDLFLMIDEKNIGSQKLATRVGYQKISRNEYQYKR